jgi:iron complex transport system substrate-binding protein
MSRTPRAGSTLLALLLLLTLVACGGTQRASSDQPASTPTVSAAATDASTEMAQFPVTVDVANGAMTLDVQPTSIISLSPTATETLFAIGAGDQVTAVDDFSTYPSEAPTTELSGYEPNVEAIAAYEPDLVVIADDGADLSTALGELDIPVMVMPAAQTMDDSYTQIELLGAATGHRAEADRLTAEMRDDIEAFTAELPETDEPLTYYHELDDTYYSVTSDTFIGQVYALAGLENIADDVEDDAGGYPQLSEEFIIDADPDLIFLADTRCCGQSAETVAERPGWDQLTAVDAGAVIELDDDVASRWGPRIVDLLETVTEAASSHSGG